MIIEDVSSQMDSVTRSVASTTTYRPHWSCQLIWDIRDVEIILPTLRKNKMIRSGILLAENKDLEQRFEWTILMEGVNETQLAISLNLSKLNKNNVDCIYDIKLGKPWTEATIVRSFHEIYIASGTKTADGRVNMTPTSDGSRKVPRCIIDLDELAQQKEVMYPDGIFRVTIDMKILQNTVSTPGTLGYPVFEDDRKSGLKHWIAGLYKNSLYSDVTIKCQGNVFPAHKFILGQSSVFAKMLKTPMKEQLSSEIEVQDLDSTVIELMLRSLYDEKFEVPSTKVELLELLHCAEKYDLQTVKSACFRQMVAITSDDNVGEFNIAAWKYQADSKLKMFFKDYCKKRHNTLIENPEYKQLFTDNLNIFI